MLPAMTDNLFCSCTHRGPKGFQRCTAAHINFKCASYQSRCEEVALQISYTTVALLLVPVPEQNGAFPEFRA
jgi:hypothetical protein